MDNPQAREQLYQRSSQTVVKVLGPATGFTSWGSDKKTEDLQESDWKFIRTLLQNSHRTGEVETLGGRTHTHIQTNVCTRTQEKGAGTPQETEPDSSVSVWETPAEAWVDSGLPLVKGN